ncbi:hypothetical protein [Chelativorans salis]|uniref:hypothetical protein n=1 Tax=Chelativorans salis TaxID=2978478 RepID=UPI003CC688B1
MALSNRPTFIRAIVPVGIPAAMLRATWRPGRPDDRDLRERMKAVAQERRRFGYRRLLVMLRREGRRTDYNSARPHSQIGWQTPDEVAQTFNPRRSSALRNVKGSAPVPVASPAHQAPPTPDTNSKLDKD